MPLGIDVTEPPAPTEAQMIIRTKPLSLMAAPATDLLIRVFPLNPVRNHRSDDGRQQIVFPESLRPFSRVSPVSTVEGRKRTQGWTRILTVTSEKNAIKEAENKRAPKFSTGQLGDNRKRAKQTTVNDKNVFPKED